MKSFKRSMIDFYFSYNTRGNKLHFVSTYAQYNTSIYVYLALLKILVEVFRKMRGRIIIVA